MTVAPKAQGGLSSSPRKGDGKALGTSAPGCAPCNLGSHKEVERLTSDLVVIANEAGDVAMGKLPLHAGRGEAGVGAGQLGSCRQDQSEWEEETAVNGEAGEMAPNHSLGWMFPRGLHRLTSLPSNSRHPPQPLPTHVYSQQLGLLVQKFALHPCPMPVSLKRRREVGPSGVDRGMLWRGKSSPS